MKRVPLASTASAVGRRRPLGPATEVTVPSGVIRSTRALAVSATYRTSPGPNARLLGSARPSTTVVDQPFQHSFVYGLVPPAEINVKDRCPNSVAKVETEHSFVNGVVTVLTASLYTPIHVRVTCATR